MSKPPEERQYGGNTGYADEHRVLYRYDSTVANHKQVAAGDFVLLRGRDNAFGAALVESIASEAGTKTLQRCPECATTGIKARKHATPVWRCNNKHSFATPTADSIPVVHYVAKFEGSYVDLDSPIAAASIKAAALRPNDQISIEEVSLGALEAELLGACPETRALIEEFSRHLDPGPEVGSQDTSAGFTGSQTDGRQAVVRSILARRGQSSFRRSLIARYGPRCMITGCALMDLVEGAHIKPYRGDEDNSPLNGLLLRADLHTMYDLYLLGINPDTLTVHLHPKALQAGYDQYNGIKLGVLGNKRPALQPLTERWIEYEKRLAIG